MRSGSITGRACGGSHGLGFDPAAVTGSKGATREASGGAEAWSRFKGSRRIGPARPELRPPLDGCAWAAVNALEAQANLHGLEVARPDVSERDEIFAFMRRVRVGLLGESCVPRTYQGPDSIDPDFCEFERHYHATTGSGHFLLLRELGADIAGSGALLRVDEDRVELKKMYLDDRLRGCGLGSKLLDALLAISASDGYRTVQLRTRPKMTAAIALYESRGFERTTSLLAPCYLFYELQLQRRQARAA
ncbi:MAG: GNAT family N-acetyltransferase [Deltaproteobacteria bacterium]|nr:GNAT family N-acetyltransferase [Deltaproteobacteria bacterium]